ncbi:ATP-binding protein [Streptomyces sp. F63]|uniref:ATP-binding protein n=1 Tax=Streptomyces sp. F63 TaxID=2824887 RepID=UPI001B37827C|nr:ATP-binding protein [Streptomyces sp. F63]MBQ0985439.1 ATP-binding protein [Streptomyces sp. F63]
MLTGTTTSGEGSRRGAGAPVAEAVAPTGEARERPAPVRQFSARFASSPRGARLARRLAVRRMEDWGYPPDSDTSCAIAVVVGELAANAVRHGRVPGRDFGLRLRLDEVAGLVRIEVADAAGGKRPPAGPVPPCPEHESGRGLLLVDVLAVRWGWAPRQPVGKTVWAEVPAEVPAEASAAPLSG